MTSLWTLVEQQCQLPTTLEDAVDRLHLILADDVKTAIAALDKSRLIELHFSLGKAIRNGFDLYQQDSALCLACGTSNADDASLIIIYHLWKRLNE